jgi:hypothetical protein
MQVAFRKRTSSLAKQCEVKSPYRTAQPTSNTADPHQRRVRACHVRAEELEDTTKWIKMSLFEKGEVLDKLDRGVSPSTFEHQYLM